MEKQLNNPDPQQQEALRHLERTLKSINELPELTSSLPAPPDSSDVYPPAPSTPVQAAIAGVEAVEAVFASLEHPLTPEDRKRLVAASYKRYSFIAQAYAAAMENQTLMPNYLNSKFTYDFHLYEDLRHLYALITELQRVVYDSMLWQGDLAYSDALAFYKVVKDAAANNIPRADAVFRDLKKFFENNGHKNRADSEPTEEQTLRDARALLHGTKEGTVVIENALPAVETHSRAAVLDDTHREHHAEFKQSEELTIDN